jgi:hypothetical protein
LIRNNAIMCLSGFVIQFQVLPHKTAAPSEIGISKVLVPRPHS